MTETISGARRVQRRLEHRTISQSEVTFTTDAAATNLNLNMGGRRQSKSDRVRVSGVDEEHKK